MWFGISFIAFRQYDHQCQERHIVWDSLGICSFYGDKPNRMGLCVFGHIASNFAQARRFHYLSPQ